MKRIETIASLIKPYTKIADIGCDHGFVIKYGIDKCGVQLAYAIDNKSGPLNNAKSVLKGYRQVKFFLSNGIEKVDKNIEVVIIAGMGGYLIRNILTENFENLKLVKKIIVGANRDSDLIRNFLNKNGYIINNEKMIFEDGKYYEIDSFEKGTVIYTNKQIEYGPIFLKEKSDIFLNKWSQVYNKYKSLENFADKNKLAELEDLLK